MKRDPFLDYLRGIAMLWIVAQHAVGAVRQVAPFDPTILAIWQAAYFEMPLLFFVSGASLYHSHQRHPAVGPYLVSRFRRLVLPYLPVAAICATAFYAQEVASGRPLTSEQAFSWLTFLPHTVVPAGVGTVTWFVPVILAVSLAHALLIRLFLSDKLRLLTALALLAGVLAFSATVHFDPAPQMMTLQRVPQHTVFYSLFVYLGYYCASGRLSLRPLRSVLLGVLSVLVWVNLAAVGAISWWTTLNKFPPNVGYLLIAVPWLAFWLHSRGWVMGLADRVQFFRAVLVFFGVHSYSIFLYHQFAIWFLVTALAALGSSQVLAVRSGAIAFVLASVVLSATLVRVLDAPSTILTGFRTARSGCSARTSRSTASG